MINVTVLQGECKGKAPHMLTFAVEGGEMISNQRQNALYPWIGKLGMPESQSGCVGVEKTVCPYWELNCAQPSNDESFYKQSYPGS
jgi:hypothetical protein